MTSRVESNRSFRTHRTKTRADILALVRKQRNNVLCGLNLIYNFDRALSRCCIDYSFVGNKLITFCLIELYLYK